jgi:hypothetical protein
LDLRDIKVSKTGGLEISSRTAYIIALPAVTAMYGAMYQYLKTGEGPKDFKDLYFPRTGKTTPDGRAERISIPSYIKDVAAYTGHGAMGAVTTVGHKLHPLLSLLNQVFITNQDYYGTMIRNTDDPAVQQLQDTMNHVAKQFIPFSVIGMQKHVGESAADRAESFLGLNPAPKSLTQTPAEAMIDKIAAKHRETGPFTKEEMAHNRARSDFSAGLHKTTGLPADVLEAGIESGLQPAEVVSLLRNSQKPQNVVKMIKATPHESMMVWRAAAGNAEERQWLYPIVVRKLATNKALSPQERLSYMEELRNGRGQ